MFTDGFQRIHELLVFDEGGHRSWFIGSTVLSGLYRYYWCLMFYRIEDGKEILTAATS